jgi:hypothetical protein
VDDLLANPMDMPYKITMERRHNILVEYEDGSLQWLQNALENEAARLPGVVRVKAQCNSEFRVPLDRWRTGETDLQKVVISEPWPCGMG